MAKYLLQSELIDGSLVNDVPVRTKAAAISAARALARDASKRIAAGGYSDVARYLVSDAEEMTVFSATVRRFPS